MEIFTWLPRVNASSNVEFAIRKAKFGDGYEQVSGAGINPKSMRWTLDFVGNEKHITEIIAFLDRHEGHKSFIWTPPLASKGLFRCESYKYQAIDYKTYALSTEFIEAHAP
ncbi:Gp17 [Xenorhabdus bovienii str. Jollieti]|uniref:Gp17 n=1 Tax=Xenorhabdus bovienii (strain SS-2004) TaxID=406818 RepID=D3UZG6_XENBS|nr:phage tail protein [Xenorhabdus bovienii]CBJ79809.1 Gp17 [Xenorhabdus bovienii SS-2004]CBJ81181.1 Gp17 [Xenorhabdus bovienii SS-2004]CDH26996.1 Gp17 [Xenorhabdus bovienii str. Jollieti]